MRDEGAMLRREDLRLWEISAGVRVNVSNVLPGGGSREEGYPAYP